MEASVAVAAIEAAIEAPMESEALSPVQVEVDEAAAAPAAAANNELWGNDEDAPIEYDEMMIIGGSNSQHDVLPQFCRRNIPRHVRPPTCACRISLICKLYLDEPAVRCACELVASKIEKHTKISSVRRSVHDAEQRQPGAQNKPSAHVGSART